MSLGADNQLRHPQRTAPFTWYWPVTLGLLLVGVGLTFGGIGVGLAFLVLGLAFLILRPFRARSLFWPLIIACAVLAITVSLTAPESCSTRLDASHEAHQTCENLMGIHEARNQGYAFALLLGFALALGSGSLVLRAVSESHGLIANPQGGGWAPHASGARPFRVSLGSRSRGPGISDNPTSHRQGAANPNPSMPSRTPRRKA